jgi:hypothetical protein
VVIVVNLARTYPAAARAVADLGYSLAKQAKVADLAAIAAAAAGPWYRVSDLRVADAGDVVVGAYAGEAVGAWRIVDHKQRTDGTVMFELKPAPEWHQLIGAPVPGGPWSQGESRPVRYIATEEYARYQGAASVTSWKSNMWSAAVGHHGRISRSPVSVTSFATPAQVAFSWPHVGPIELRLTDTGILEISVPHGLRTRVTHQPAPKPPRRRRAAEK